MDPGYNRYDVQLSHDQFHEIESALLRHTSEPKANELLQNVKILHLNNRDTPKQILDLISRMGKLSGISISQKIFNEVFAVLLKADPDIVAHIQSKPAKKETSPYISANQLASLQYIIIEELKNDPLVQALIEKTEEEKETKKSRVILRKPLETQPTILKNISFVFYSLSKKRDRLILDILKENPQSPLNKIREAYFQSFIGSENERELQKTYEYIDRFIETYPHFANQTHEQISEQLQPTVDDLLDELATVFSTSFGEVQKETIERIISKIADKLEIDAIELQKKYNKKADEMKPEPVHDTEKKAAAKNQSKKSVRHMAKVDLPLQYDKVQLDSKIGSRVEQGLYAERPNVRLWNCFMHAAFESQSQTHPSKSSKPKTLLSEFIDRSLPLIKTDSPDDRLFFAVLQNVLNNEGTSLEAPLWETVCKAQEELELQVNDQYDALTEPLKHINLSDENEFDQITAFIKSSLGNEAASCIKILKEHKAQIETLENLFFMLTSYKIANKKDLNIEFKQLMKLIGDRYSIKDLWNTFISSETLLTNMIHITDSE